MGCESDQRSEQKGKREKDKYGRKGRIRVQVPGHSNTKNQQLPSPNYCYYCESLSQYQLLQSGFDNRRPYRDRSRGAVSSCPDKEKFVTKSGRGLNSVLSCKLVRELPSV